MQDSERKPPESPAPPQLSLGLSWGQLTECLCDERKIPLLHDPALAEVDLCYKAIPHYKSFVTKRETLVNKRIKEGKTAARLEESAEKAEKYAKEKEAKELGQEEKKKQKQEKERQGEEREKEQLERNFALGGGGGLAGLGGGVWRMVAACRF